MSAREPPLNALRLVLDAINGGEKAAGLRNMTEDVTIIDDIPPFHRTGRREAELWFRRLDVARTRLNACLKLQQAHVCMKDDRAYIVGDCIFTASVEGTDTDATGTLTASLVQPREKWLVRALVWSSKH
jgi:ketosteroid isomerase-like protein